ncbi:MAG: O-antigen ligase family protein [Verrucomicrobiae bacterium]
MEIAAVAALAVLPAFGGAWWPAGVAVACVAMRPSAGGALGIFLGCLALLPLAALAPPWGPMPWAAALPGLPSSVTPQPLALLAAWPGYLAGLAYLWWICGRSRDGFLEARQSGMLLLAIAGSLLLAAGRWESGAWRGPLAGIFEAVLGTRNQAGGYAAVAVAACAMKTLFAEDARKRLLWAAGAAACAIPLVTLGSRGAVGAAAIGCAAGWALPAMRPKRWRAALAGCAAIFFLAVLVVALWPQAPIVGRFWSSGVTGAGTRMEIQADAWRLLAAFPLTGIGLGNFEAVFPFFRMASASPWRAYHPESDWLWLACEAGLVAGILAWAAVAVLAARLWRMAGARPGAAAVGFSALAAVAAHGLLDVPAHCAPVFVLACALAGTGSAGGREGSRLLPWAVALGLAASSCLALRWTPASRPEVIRPDRPMPVSAAARAWLEFRPLDADVLELEVHRAIRADDKRLAERLMGRLFLLEPFSSAPAARAFALLVDCGDAGMALIPARAILERTPAPERAWQLEKLLRMGAELPELRSGILSLPPTTAATQAVRMAFLGRGLPPEESLRLAELAGRADDPGVPAPLAIAALELAASAGHEESLLRAAGIPSLAGPLSAVRALRLAESGDFESACRLAAASPGMTEKQMLSSPTTPAPVLLALQEMRAGNPGRARALLHAFEARHAASPELWFVLGCAEWQIGSPERAWIAFEKFLGFGQSASYGNPRSR